MKDLAIVGLRGGTHIAGSLERAARGLGLRVMFYDVARAFEAPDWWRRLNWHLRGHRPPRLQSFQIDLIRTLGALRPSTLLVVGQAPVTRTTLVKLKTLGIRLLHYSTDDPWNPSHKATWLLSGLPFYDVIFTPRRTNVDDFIRAGCNKVIVLPFGFDAEIYGLESEQVFALPDTSDYDVLFVGGADRDRASMLAPLARKGIKLKLLGGYWDQYTELKAFWGGIADVAGVLTETRKAPVNLCLVRRANRDEHVMRSFEIAAAGGFGLMEDTQQHREIFGPEGECVLYFSNSSEAAQKITWALFNPSDRLQMKRASHRKIAEGRNTYSDRLEQMLRHTT